MVKTEAQRQRECRSRKQAKDPNYNRKRADKEKKRRKEKKEQQLRDPLAMSDLILKHQAKEREDFLEHQAKEHKDILEHQAKEHKELLSRVSKQGNKARKYVTNLFGMAVVGPYGSDRVLKPNTKENQDHVYDLSEGEIRENETLCEDGYTTDCEEQSHASDFSRFNRRRKRKWGHDNITFPLTEDSKAIHVDFYNDRDLSTVGSKVCHEAFETYVPGLKRTSGLGKILQQVEDRLEPPELLEDLQYIAWGRSKLQHQKWVYRLDDRRMYAETLMRVMHHLCPNWTLHPYNPEAERLEKLLDDRDAKIARLEQELALAYQDDFECEYGRPGKRRRNQGSYY